MNPTRPIDDDALDPALAALWRAADAETHAPAGFDQRLFARLEREAPVRAIAVDPGLVAWALPALPFWVRAAGERHVALALLAAGTIVAWPAWWALGAAYTAVGGTTLAHALEQLFAPTTKLLLAPLAVPRVALMVSVCLAPALAWASFEIPRAAERWARRVAFGRAARVRVR